MSASNDPGPLAKALSLGLVAVILIALVGGLMAFEGVDEGSVAVEKRHGAVTGNVMGPGWHFITPISEDTVHIDTRPRTEDMVGEQAIPLLTGDGQDVVMDVSVRYSVEPENADEFHTQYRDHDKALNDLIQPTIYSNARHEASALQASQIITRDGRLTLQETVATSLHEQTEGTGITIEAVQVRDVRLNKEYGAALEAVEIENTKAEQRIIRAESEAEANNIRTESLSDAVLMEKYLDTIDDSDKVVLATGDDGTPIILDGASEGAASASGQTTDSGELTEGDGGGGGNESSGNESGGDGGGN